MREQRAGMELEGSILACVHADADNVRWQQIGSELHALEGESQRCRQRVCQRGLADARQIFDQQMATGEKTGKGKAYLWIFPSTTWFTCCKARVSALASAGSRGGAAGAAGARRLMVMAWNRAWVRV